jgi:hypothetical protein
MKWIKRSLTLLAICLLLSLAGALGWVHYYLNSPRMSEKIRRIVSERFLTRLEFEKAHINLLSGMRVEKARLLTDEEPGQEYASLEEALLEYSPLSLFRHTIEIDTIRLKSPIVHLRQRDDGHWLNPRESSDPAAEMTLKTSIFRFNILLNKLILEKGALTLSNARNETLLAAQGIDVKGQLQLINGRNDAKGTVLLKTLLLGSGLQLTDISSSFDYADSVLKLPGIKGRVHGGTCEGLVQLNTGLGGNNFLFDMTMREIDLASLLQTLPGDTRQLQGRLQINLQLTGDLNGSAPMQGTGTLEVGQAKLTGIAALDKLGDLLNLSQLRDSRFDSIRGSFKVGEQQITFYELEARSKDFSLAGTGSIGLDHKLDFDVLLILSPELAAQIPADSLSRFSKRENGSRTLTFKLGGTLDNPSSNLSDKLTAPDTSPESNEQASLPGEAPKQNHPL